MPAIIILHFYWVHYYEGESATANGLGDFLVFTKKVYKLKCYRSLKKNKKSVIKHTQGSKLAKDLVWQM